MPTIITHSVVAVAAGVTFAPKGIMPPRFWALSLLCSSLPDADVIAFTFGIPYGAMFGHRGFFHSLFFALLVGLLVGSLFFWGTKIGTSRWWFYIIYFTLLTASHGLLDALTDGGMGIALLSPFDTTRYFFPWTPIAVSPIGMRFFSAWGLRVLKNEICWVWLPSCLLILGSRVLRLGLIK